MKKIGLSILFAVFLITSLVDAADKGKVAVAAEGKAATAQVSGVAARSPYFLIFDGDGKLLEAIDNPYRVTKGSAGTSVVPFLAQKGVTFVVAGEFGENMIQTMKSNGVKYLEFQGRADAGVKKILEASK